MAKDDKIRKNPAVKSMLTLALYLVLLIGMWSIIAKWVFPTTTDLSRAKELVKEYPALLAQLAENSADSTQWEGIQESDTVQTLYDTYNVTYVETVNGCTHFYMKVTDASTTHALVYAPQGEYLPPEGDWAKTEGESSTQYVLDATTITVTRLADNFFYEESVVSYS